MTNTDTETTTTIHYHVGWNMPGYLPECDVFTTKELDYARWYLIDELGFHADNSETWVDEHDCDDIPCPTYGDSCPWDMAQDMRAIADDLEQSDSWALARNGWTGYAGNLAYWIMVCADDCEVEDLR